MGAQKRCRERFTQAGSGEVALPAIMEPSQILHDARAKLEEKGRLPLKTLGRTLPLADKLSDVDELVELWQLAAKKNPGDVTKQLLGLLSPRVDYERLWQRLYALKSTFIDWQEVAAPFRAPLCHSAPQLLALARALVRKKPIAPAGPGYWSGKKRGPGDALELLCEILIYVKLTKAQSRELVSVILEAARRHPNEDLVHSDLPRYALRRGGREARAALVDLMTFALSSAHWKGRYASSVLASREAILADGGPRACSILFADYVEKLSQHLFEHGGPAVAKLIGDASQSWSDEMTWVFVEMGLKCGESSKYLSAREIKASPVRRRILEALDRHATVGPGRDAVDKLMARAGLKRLAKPIKRPPKVLPATLSKALALVDELGLTQADLPRGAGARRSDILAAEQRLGQKLPHDLRALLERHDGFGPIVSARKLPAAQKTFRHWARSILEENAEEERVGRDEGTDLRALLPLEGLLPIAEMPENPNFAFVRMKNGTVFLFDHDDLGCRKLQSSIARYVAAVIVSAWAKREGEPSPYPYGT